MFRKRKGAFVGLAMMGMARSARYVWGVSLSVALVFALAPSAGANGVGFGDSDDPLITSLSILPGLWTNDIGFSDVIEIAAIDFHSLEFGVFDLSYELFTTGPINIIGSTGTLEPSGAQFLVFFDYVPGPEFGSFPLSLTVTDEAGNTSSRFEGYTILDAPALVPLPAALPLFGGALAMLGIVGWRKKRKPSAA
jgi:hypothetical protein